MAADGLKWMLALDLVGRPRCLTSHIEPRRKEGTSAFFFLVLTLAYAGIFRVLTNVFSSRKLLVVLGSNKLNTRTFGGCSD